MSAASSFLSVHVSRCEGSFLPEIPGDPVFRVPKSFTFGQFKHMVRMRIHLAPEQSLFMFVERELPPGSILLMCLVNRCRSRVDGLLHVKYDGETTFG